MVSIPLMAEDAEYFFPLSLAPSTTGVDGYFVNLDLGHTCTAHTSGHLNSTSIGGERECPVLLQLTKMRRTACFQAVSSQPAHCEQGGFIFEDVCVWGGEPGC